MRTRYASRRKFLLAGLGLFTLGFSRKNASAREVRIAADEPQTCATCNFWGGKREISADGQWVVGYGTGTCSNPRSPVYGKKTEARLGSFVWRKWSDLP